MIFSTHPIPKKNKKDDTTALFPQTQRLSLPLQGKSETHFNFIPLPFLRSDLVHKTSPIFGTHPGSPFNSGIPAHSWGLSPLIPEIPLLKTLIRDPRKTPGQTPPGDPFILYLHRH
ncbi:hypothetical protein CEXT_665121 [Caerostris extrusa]|uniref:Uncharacterized protein n=1 Tax=Caerostris extrusa TaxID=172846 RepID=A0AAV4RLC9_CAEEX|nr:hypothetical protein CEXT_665121 [Caerostris extrusa]